MPARHRQPPERTPAPKSALRLDTWSMSLSGVRRRHQPRPLGWRARRRLPAVVAGHVMEVAPHLRLARFLHARRCARGGRHLSPVQSEGEGRSKKWRCPAASLTDDLIVEILSRLPVKSLCRFKYISKTWENLISDPEHCRNLPQTLAGFFYGSPIGPGLPLHFSNVLQRETRPMCFPRFSFRPRCQRIVLSDSCNGLLLYRCLEAMGDTEYVVVNPATKKWVALPSSSQGGKMCEARLGFDPGVSSSHFHVFKFVEYDDDFITGVEIYSSKTGGWVHKEIEWSGHIVLIDSPWAYVFLNGSLHFLHDEPNVAVVDTEGKTWRNIRVPEDWKQDEGFIQQSQGCLHYAKFEKDRVAPRLAVYVLEDYDSQKWVLKHRIETSYVSDLEVNIGWIAIHPECNLVFFTAGREKTLMSYDMDHRHVQVIRDLGHDSQSPYLSYVPFYLELEGLHM